MLEKNKKNTPKFNGNSPSPKSKSPNLLSDYIPSCACFPLQLLNERQYVRHLAPLFFLLEVNHPTLKPVRCGRCAYACIYVEQLLGALRNARLMLHRGMVFIGLQLHSRGDD